MEDYITTLKECISEIESTQKISNSELQEVLNDISTELSDKQNKICRGDI